MSLGADSRRLTASLDQGEAVRKLVANTFMSLDGVMQAQGGPESLHRRER
jgi:hypothetical protein